MTESCLLTLICSREIEEKLVDTLLTEIDDEVFISMPAFSHGTAQRPLSSIEKVMGHSRSVQVQIVITEKTLTSLIELLKLRFKGTGLRYWVATLSAEGEVA